MGEARGAAPELRVLHLDSERGFGGGQRQLLFLMRSLARSGGVVQALGARRGSEIVTRSGEHGVAFLPLGQRNDLDIVSAFRLARLVARFRPDVVHAHTGRSLAMTWLSRKLTGLRRPPIIVATRRVAIPLSGRWASWKARGGADHHVAISRACRDQLLGAGVPPEDVTVIPSGVDVPERIERDAARRRLLALTGLNAGFVTVGTSGSLTRVKRFDRLIGALAVVRRQMPSVRLVVFGKGPLRARLGSAAADLGQGGAVVFAGHVDRPERFFAGLDLFAMASESEGLNTSFIDAMARGVPLLGPGTTGVLDVIEDGVNGLLFDPGLQGDLAERLTRLCADQDLRRTLGAAGPGMARERFDIRDVTRRTLELYRGMLGSALES